MPSHSSVVESAGAIRLDRYIAEQLKLLSRSQIKARRLSALLNGKEAKLSREVKTGDTLELSWDDAENSNLEPENIPLKILYEDDNAVVVDKEQGLVVHPGAGRPRGTLANALLYRRLERGPRGQETPPGLRAGIVHRLDKDTSGVIIAAYNDETLAYLAEQFKERKVRKRYIALVKGTPPHESGIVDKRIVRDSRDRKRFTVTETGGKTALTRYRVLRRFQNHTLLLLKPKTGRTHQLRVHLKYLKCPIVGDPVYGEKDRLFPEATLMLHARKLFLTLPPSGRLMTFKSPLPQRFREALKILAD